jgi:hypothetical protein
VALAGTLNTTQQHFPYPNLDPCRAILLCGGTAGGQYIEALNDLGERANMTQSFDTIDSCQAGIRIAPNAKGMTFEEEMSALFEATKYDPEPSWPNDYRQGRKDAIRIIWDLWRDLEKKCKEAAK